MSNSSAEMDKSPAECRAELARLQWLVYTSAVGKLWRVTAYRGVQVCSSTGQDRQQVWNDLLRQALDCDPPRPPARDKSENTLGRSVRRTRRRKPKPFPR